MSLSGKKSLVWPSAALVAAVLLFLLFCAGLKPVRAEQPAEEQRATQSQEICRPADRGKTTDRCPRCCAKKVSGNECARCGHPLTLPRESFSYPGLQDSEYAARLNELRKMDRSIGRSMGRLDENLRNMKTTINRIRTIDRQIRAFHRR